MHVHDSRGEDDHLAPGEGDIDFSRFTAFARSVGHMVFEPSADVDEERLKKGLQFIRSLWSGAESVK
jgi:sugar phosphate isomerase/epimerase